MPRARADDLGLRRALSDRLLPALVAAMIFLAALALAGATGAASLADRWHGGAASLLLVQVPHPEDPAPGQMTRAEAVSVALAAAPGVRQARRLTASDIAALLRPWLGTDPQSLSLPLPAMFEVTLSGDAAAPALQSLLARAAPGVVTERGDTWLQRLSALVRSLQACAALALGVVAFVAVAVVAVATRAGLAARRDAIDIVHGLGAADGMIARRFAGRITALVFSGAVVGLVLAVPMVLSLAQLAAPFQARLPDPQPAGLLAVLPPLLWLGLAALPPAASLIAWITAQMTVRGWLARLT